MFEDIKIIYMNVNILKFWAVLYDHNYRRYICLLPSTFLVFTQICYMCMTTDGIDTIILNSYILVLWSNTILRAYSLLYNSKKYQNLIEVVAKHFYILKNSKDVYIKTLLEDATSMGMTMSKGNLFFGLLSCIGFVLYPMFVKGKVLPYGSKIPGIDEYQSPYYEVWYVLQAILTPMGCTLYIPYTSFIVTLIMFGIVLCKVLQHRLRSLKCCKENPLSIQQQVIECIQFQQEIIDFVETVDDLTTLIFLLEFIGFGAVLCALLFLLIIVDSLAQIIIVCFYINMILAQIFALYWYANELQEQNFQVAAAAYESEWFTYDCRVQKNIQLLILRAQKPCSLKVGNMYFMTLELFQSLLNASYTYFTLLKRVYA